MLLGSLLSSHKAPCELIHSRLCWWYQISISLPRSLTLALQPTWLFPLTSTSSYTKLNLASQTSLSFQLSPSASSTSSLQMPQRKKVGEPFLLKPPIITLYQICQKARHFLQNVSTFSLFLLIPANSILVQGFTALCLYYLKQILSCLPASESSYTPATRII